MNILLSLILVFTFLQSVTLVILLLQVRGFLIDFYANANHTGVEIPDDEFEGEDYLNGNEDLATVLNALMPLKNHKESERLEASEATETESALQWTQPPSFTDLFDLPTGVEIPEDEYGDDNVRRSS